MKSLVSSTLGIEWIRLHPGSFENIPEGKDVFARILLNTLNQ
jgi:hypothetical protein